MHCLSSSGRRDPRELSTAECRAVIDELQRMQVFYVNIGGGEPTVRRDFWELVDYAIGHHVGVKFSTNGSRITEAVARRWPPPTTSTSRSRSTARPPQVNDAVRGAGSYATAITAMERLAAAGMTGFKISVVVTRHNVAQLDAFEAIADRYGAQLRITRLRPSGRGADVWDELHPTARQQRELYDWLVERGERVLTGDSFFHLAALRRPAAGAEPVRRRAGRLPDRSGRRRLRLPVRDPRGVLGRQRARTAAALPRVAGIRPVPRPAPAPDRRRLPVCGHYDACRGGCMAAKFFTGLPLDGPDPECVLGHGESLLDLARDRQVPRAGADHSRRPPRPPVPDCDESPLAGLTIEPG